jgi:hypothetical protein
VAEASSCSPHSKNMSNDEQTRRGIAIDPKVAGADNESTDDAESTRSSTASVSSSIYEYRRIQGRTYQSSHTTDYWYSKTDSNLM